MLLIVQTEYLGLLCGMDILLCTITASDAGQVGTKSVSSGDKRKKWYYIPPSIHDWLSVVHDSLCVRHKYTLKHEEFLHEFYMKCQRKFKRMCNGGWVPHRNIIHNIVNKVKTTGMLVDRKPKFQCWVLSELLV